MAYPSNASGGPGGSDADVEYELSAGERPSTAVVSAVAAASDVPPERLPTLYDTVDPEALDRLFGDGTGDPTAGVGTVSFAYADFTVTVTDGRSVRVRPIDSK